MSRTYLGKLSLPNAEVFLCSCAYHGLTHFCSDTCCLETPLLTLFEHSVRRLIMLHIYTRRHSLRQYQTEPRSSQAQLQDSWCLSIAYSYNHRAHIYDVLFSFSIWNDEVLSGSSFFSSLSQALAAAKVRCHSQKPVPAPDFRRLILLG